MLMPHLESDQRSRNAFNSIRLSSWFLVLLVVLLLSMVKVTFTTLQTMLFSSMRYLALFRSVFQEIYGNFNSHHSQLGAFITLLFQSYEQ